MPVAAYPSTRPTRARRSRRPFLSLKWRALLLTSLVLLGLAAMYTLLSHANLNLQFEQHREVIHERQARESKLAMASSQEHLQQLGSLLPSLSGMGPALQRRDRSAVAASFDPQWPVIQLEVGVDEVLIFSSEAEQLGAWGEPLGNPERGAAPPITDWIREALDQQTPRHALWCENRCRQYAVVPLLVDGMLGGAVVLSRSLAEVALNAQRISGSDIGLLIDRAQPDPDLVPDRHLEPWSGNVAILTGELHTRPVLHAASSLWTLETLVHSPRQLDWQDQHYELTALPLEVTPGSRAGHLLLISDITEQMHAIRQDTRTALAVALSGWLAAELLLLGILWGPMDRLRRLSEQLPLLARGEFQAVRRAVGQPRKQLADEIDLIDVVTLDLSSQLEALEERVKARDRELSARMVELGRQRDFVNRLLDTARVIIVTHDAGGRVSLVNAYGQSLVGQSGDEIRGQHFRDVFMNGGGDRPTEELLSQEETALIGNDGESRTIAWYHAPLHNAETGNATVISVGLDVTARKAAEERLSWLASHDPLTNLPNRRAFQLAMEQAFERPSARGAILFLDLDQFKDINDFSGHQSGDQLLNLVAEALEEVVGTDGIVARLGGDEFGILLRDAEEAQATALAERVARRLERVALPVGGLRHRTTASVGVALFPRHGDNPLDLMASADLAMYQAKDAGPGHWHILPTANKVREAVQERVYWVEYLRDALVEEKFELFAQPLLRLADDHVNHYELLVRMRGPNGELVSPGRFIPIAEHSRQIVELDRWVLRKALELMHRLHRSRPDLHLAVNLSAHSLHSEDLYDMLAGELRRLGIDASHLTLEITETAAVTDFVKAKGMISRIRELGCHFSLDDFGVGFSSFHYLRQLPASFVKIDGLFIRDLERNSDDRLLVQAMVNIAHGFGKQTVAEYVGSAEVLELLREYGVTYAQGFFISHPMPISEAFGPILAAGERQKSDVIRLPSHGGSRSPRRGGSK
ncbi:bifunctional diguanylate cyclase/phosphodiesterase [Thioalkalivibrio paradoxus]|uniref:Diguanylate cyclase n=1 Tax=Thioalkalivibrio paradoxus ARh 1 TaxID=713585 RepID=W0DFT2_9GAMM|nr:EAL domain-containing protein [Thioalkalivibrio paradoxus]AHE97201.1 hypothetical protein THITH_01735 [Thioalkalivibrio paradoxus ARh 1]